MVALLLIALASQAPPAAGAIGDPVAALRGVWVADKEALVAEAPDYAQLTGDARKAFHDKMIAALPDTTFDFKAETFTVAFGGESTLVNYRVALVDGVRVRLDTSETSSTGKVETDEVTVEFVARDRLILRKKGDSLKLTLNRSR